MVKAELWHGAERSEHRHKNLDAVIKFPLPFEIIAFDDTAAIIYSKIRAQLEQKGTLVGPNDLIIAATVMAHRGRLVTNTIREFKRVPSLKTENWIKPSQ